MGGGGGAVVAAAAAARKKRRERIIDGFRIADATAPERSRSLTEIGLSEGGELEDLMRAGVICPGRQKSTWYLNEAAFIGWRDSGSRQNLRVLLVVALAVLAILMGVLASRVGR
jgi:hypothetical protein